MQVKKVLFVASVTGHITAFHLPFLEHFKNKGYMVEVAANGEKEIPFCDTRHQVCFARNPVNKSNFSAYGKLKKIIQQKNYDIVHCHTPVAAMMTRIAARKMRKCGTRVIYTAHGFHFYKGASIKNWLVYFPVEWICSFFTDDIITINKEDYAFAEKKLHSKRLHYVPGVGIDVDEFSDVVVDREKKRDELGIPRDCIAILSVGEINDNKNQEVVLRAIAKNPRKDIYYVICGKGGKTEYLQNLAKELGMGDRLIMPGFRKDVPEIYRCCDLFAFPSFREGLSVSLMEAMCSGLPVMCSAIRGNVDLIEEMKGGFLFDPHSVESVSTALNRFLECDCMNEIIEYNKNKIKEFSLEAVNKQMREIYGCAKD